jgi:hypothetical protein
MTPTTPASTKTTKIFFAISHTYEEFLSERAGVGLNKTRKNRQGDPVADPRVDLRQVVFTEKFDNSPTSPTDVSH